MEQPNGRSDVPVARKRKQQQQPSTGDNAPKTRSVTQRERLLAFETEARNFTLRLRADAEAQIELNRVLFRTVRRMVRRGNFSFGYRPCRLNVIKFNTFFF